MSKSLESKKTHVTIKHDHVDDATTLEASTTLGSSGVSGAGFDLVKFKENLKINIISMNDEEMVFDLIGVEAPIANSLRRILISEVPTMAFENIYLMNNTSIVQDEVLCHRIGLIPIKADPRLFEFKQADRDPNDRDTLVFNLNITCKKRPGIPNDAPEDEKYENSKVYSGHFIWDRQGDQGTEAFPLEDVEPVHKDILLAKLRPGQSIELQAHVVKGIGKDHAKFSPVSTASYRLLPDITFKQPVVGSEAEQLVKMCPMGVFDIEDTPIPAGSKGGKGKKAVVKNARNCTMCRECIRHPGWDEKIALQRVKDHFIFSIESTGALVPAVLFSEAITILYAKCAEIEALLQAEASA